MRGFEKALSILVEPLVEQGWVVTNTWWPAELVRALAEEARSLWRAGKFHVAGVGRGPHYQVRPDIRGDFILWLEDIAPTPAQRAYREEIERLRKALNEALFLGLQEFEAHYAVFPPGAFYRRHRDRFRTADERVISCILYLNPDWSESDGGALRIYDPAQGEVDVWPREGTFVLLRSDTVEHEVLPTRRERFSLTGWFRRRPLSFRL